MVYSAKRMLLGALLLSAPLFSACERIDTISSIETTDFAASPGRSKKAKLVVAAVTESGTVQGMATHGRSLTLQIGQYVLEVPKGAVKEPTTFRMTVVPGDMVKVSLEAWDANDPSVEVKQFRQPLNLTLPYSAIAPEDRANPGLLLIGHISEDGRNQIEEVVNAVVDTNAQTITGQIFHFSIWAIVRELVAKEIIIGID